MLFIAYLKAHIDWVKFIGWVETPAGMAILLPLMPAYHVIKAAFDGVIVTPILLTLFLAVFTAVMVWEALKFAVPFCEVTFLWSERQQRLTKMGAWDAVTQEFVAKPIKSEIGFGSKATSLLWMYWLNWKRLGFWAVDLFMIAFVCALIFLGIGTKLLELPTIMMFVAIATFSLFSPRTSEWLKSQPISVNETLLVLALPNALRAVLLSLAISFPLLLFLPEKVGAVNVFAFVLAVVAWGLGINFMAQALQISWRDMPYSSFVVAICILVGNLMRMTLTTNWLLGLLLSWAACAVLYLWAKERWLKEP